MILDSLNIKAATTLESISNALNAAKMQEIESKLQSFKVELRVAGERAKYLKHMTRQTNKHRSTERQPDRMDRSAYTQIACCTRGSYIVPENHEY